MIMEKVCVYQDVESIRRSINWCETAAKHLQELADNLSTEYIVPTIGKLQSLYNGSSLLDLISESCDSQIFKGMPKSFQEIVRKDSAKKVEEIKTQAAKLINTDKISIEWEFYQVNNGNVNIKPEYKQIITDRYSIYIDTDSRADVYEKWLAMEKAINEFNEAVNNSHKNNKLYDMFAKHNPNMSFLVDARYMKGLSVFGEFSLATLYSDGKFELKGENFKYIK